MAEWVGLSQRKSEELMDGLVRRQRMGVLAKSIKDTKNIVDLRA